MGQFRDLSDQWAATNFSGSQKPLTFLVEHAEPKHRSMHPWPVVCYDCSGGTGAVVHNSLPPELGIPMSCSCLSCTMEKEGYLASLSAAEHIRSNNNMYHGSFAVGRSHAGRCWCWSAGRSSICHPSISPNEGQTHLLGIGGLASFGSISQAVSASVTPAPLASMGSPTFCSASSSSRFTSGPELLCQRPLPQQGKRHRKWLSR